MQNWINRCGHFQGVFWSICAGFFSNLCDVFIRLVSNNLPAMQITFFRLFFGAVIILPLLIYKGRSSFFVRNKRSHCLRVIIGFGAMACWVYGASQTSLLSITVISFTCPLFVLPLAYMFLGEKSDWKRILSVIIGFLGVIIIAFFESKGVKQITNNTVLHFGIVFLFLGAVLFAVSDILNKKMLASENFYSLLFYFYLGTALISFIPALLVWKQMQYEELYCLLVLGMSGALVLYCILKAANAAEISSIAPYRYLELVFSMIMGYLLFKEVIQTHTMIGAALIIPNVLLIAYHEINKEKKIIKDC